MYLPTASNPIYPPPCQQLEHQHDDNPAMGNLPSCLICPLSGEHPLNAHIFAIPHGNNNTSEQEYGYNDTYQFISTPVILEAAWNVFYPKTRESI